LHPRENHPRADPKVACAMLSDPGQHGFVTQ
jgi:hypothetical protein